MSWSVAARATCLGRANVFSLLGTIQTRWNQYWYSRPTTKTLQGRGYRYKQAYTQHSCNGTEDISNRREIDCISHHVLESWQYMRQSTVLLQELCQQFLESPHFNRNWRNCRKMQNIFWCLRHIEPEMTLAECNLVASFCRANFQSRNSNRYFIFFLVLVLTLELKFSEEWQGPLARLIASRLDITPLWVTERHWNDARFCLYFKRGCPGWAILPPRPVFFTPVHCAVM